MGIFLKIVVMLAAIIAGILAAEGLRWLVRQKMLHAHFLPDYDCEFILLPKWLQLKLFEEYGILEEKWNKLLKEKREADARRCKELDEALARKHHGK